RVGLTEMAQDEGEKLRRLARIDRRVVGANVELVAEERSQGLTLGIAADVAEERLVVDLAQLVRSQPRGVGEPDGEHARAQRELERLPHPQVRRERQRANQ